MSAAILCTVNVNNLERSARRPPMLNPVTHP